MQEAKRVVVGLLGLALLGAALAIPSARAGGIDCTARWLSPTDVAICNDPRLLRMDAELTRRLRGFARQLSFGQYLGLRHWHASQARERNACGTDRNCVVDSYRAQARLLDRLQRCIRSSLARRTCLHNLLANERESVRRRRNRDTPSH